MSDALADLVAAWRAAPGDIVRPVHEGKHGHPVIFPGDLRDELAAVNDATEGPRAVVRRHADAPARRAHRPSPRASESEHPRGLRRRT